LEALHEPRFVDLAPAQVYAQLLTEGTYLCSPRTMHRILSENKESRERRNLLRHPSYEAPQLLATKPNELWSWDITKLLGPKKWSYYNLYVVMDVFSRYVVGWLIADRESGYYAKQLMRECCQRQEINPKQLTIHADNGGPMKSKTLGQFFAELGVVKTHSRPRVSNDNPFSESQFKTLKYRPGFPKRFGCIEDARSCVKDLLDWYNNVHFHSSIAWLTPHDVHYGHASERLASRTNVLKRAFEKHPERFVNGIPKSTAVPSQVWINPPKEKANPEGPASFVLPPTRRSSCSSAELYPPSGISQYSKKEKQIHLDAPNAKNLWGLGASPPREDTRI
jgi:putative transposase